MPEFLVLDSIWFDLLRIEKFRRQTNAARLRAAIRTLRAKPTAKGRKNDAAKV